MPAQGWNVPNYWADLQEVGRRVQRGLSVRPARPGAPSLFGLQNSGAAPWEAPARAQQVPPPSSAPYVSPFAGSRQANLDRIKRDPQYAAPGLGAPAPVVTGGGRARAEALNTASQQAGGPNLSQPLVPKEQAVLDAMAQYDKERSANPLAAVPELIDQRSKAYSQRADIQAWMDAQRAKGPAGQAMVDRFLAKQRKEDPSAMQADAAGMREAYGPELGVGPGAKALSEVPYQGGLAPAGSEQLQAAYGAKLPAGMGGSLEGLPYQGPAPVAQPAAMRQDAAGFDAAFSGELDVVPQGSAQQSNLNGPESPLISANVSQGAADQQKNFQMQLGSDLLKKYQLKAGALNGYWRG